MGNAVTSSADTGLSGPRGIEKSRLIVRQPSKLKELTNLLETFENLNARVSERVGEDVSQDLGGAGAGAGATGGQQGTQGSSARDQAIKNIPVAAIMQQKLTKHVQAETRKLEKLARTVAQSSAPGAAHKLNALYAKIRRLNSLIREILEASIEVLQRFFVRVFIDQQPIL